MIFYVLSDVDEFNALFFGRGFPTVKPSLVKSSDNCFKLIFFLIAAMCSSGIWVLGIKFGCRFI